MFKSAVVATLLATAAAFTPNGDIAVDSSAGQKLMSKARALEQNGEMTWMTGYRIKYLGCTSLLQFNAEAREEEEGLLYKQNLVKFALCSESVSCSSCGSGSAQYVATLNEFVDAYTEAKMEEQERACEEVRENCYCENANDDEVCESACYEAAGMSDCVKYEDEEEFELQRYLECAELEGANNNNNNNNNNYNYYNSNGVDMSAQYWTGPVCASDGVSINLAVFTDAGCTTKAGSGVFEAFNYGASLPYASTPIIKASECTSCKQAVENNNNNNNNNNNYNNYVQYEVTEFCQQAYETAAKCETNLNVDSYYFYKDTSACTFINTLLPKLAKASGSSMSASASSTGNAVPVAFAIIFLLTSLILGAYSFFLYRKIHRAKVNLAQSEGMVMA